MTDISPCSGGANIQGKLARSAGGDEHSFQGAGFFPKERQSRHSREGGNPVIPQSTGLCAWMPAFAGTTNGRN